MFERIMQVLCAVLLVGVILTSPISAQKSRYRECLADYPLLNFVIVLDAGHGGEDGGAIGIHTLVREKDINLSIVQKLSRLFEVRARQLYLPEKMRIHYVWENIISWRICRHAQQ